MFFCCSGDDSDGNAVVIVEPAASLVADEVKDDLAAEEANFKIEKAQQGEDAGQTRKAEDEARGKKKADVAAAKEASAAPEAVGLPLTFRDAGGMKTYTVSFTTKPLGMDFHQNLKPVKVQKAFGAAKRLGVSEGSELIEIAGTNVEQLDFGAMLGVLKEKIAPLTPDGLVVNFRDQSGNQRSIVFPTKPLGMDFDKGRRPIRIKNVEGVALNLGVEKGWELMSVAGTDVEQMDFDKLLELLRAQIGSLPTMD